MKNSTALIAAGIAVGLSIGSFVSVSAATEANQVNLCVNKKTSIVTQKLKCAKTERVLSLSKAGATGPSGPAGPKGESGAAGPSGQDGSGIGLQNYPYLGAQLEILENGNCQDKWNVLLGPFNMTSDIYGQPVGNKAWVETYAGACDYPMPEIFEAPMLTEVSNVVHGTKSRTTAANVYSVPYGWEATVSSMKVKVRLEPNWHLCTVADAQYTARNLASRQAGWAAVSLNEFTYSGSLRISWGNSSNPTDFGSLDSSSVWPYFCGPDSRTPSGVGFRNIQAWYFPIRFNDPSL